MKFHVQETNKYDIKCTIKCTVMKKINAFSTKFWKKDNLIKKNNVVELGFCCQVFYGITLKSATQNTHPHSLHRRSHTFCFPAHIASSPPDCL